jgi:hypothetical protein
MDYSSRHVNAFILKISSTRLLKQMAENLLINWMAFMRDSRSLSRLMSYSGPLLKVLLHSSYRLGEYLMANETKSR